MRKMLLNPLLTYDKFEDRITRGNLKLIEDSPENLYSIIPKQEAVAVPVTQNSVKFEAREVQDKAGPNIKIFNDIV